MVLACDEGERSTFSALKSPPTRDAERARAGRGVDFELARLRPLVMGCSRPAARCRMEVSAGPSITGERIVVRGHVACCLLHDVL